MKVLSLALLLFCAGCATITPPGEQLGAVPISFDRLNGWDQDDHRTALKSFVASCVRMARSTPGPTASSNLSVPQPVWQSLCDEARSVTPVAGQAKAFFERRFTPYRINNNGREEGLFTGYYEPLLMGSRRKGGAFIHPLYAAPPELASSKPYYTRKQINDGAIAGRGLELLWVSDPVMLFFLQVQGSGRVRLPDGRELLLGFAGKNDQPYVSLGKVMGDEGLIAKDKVDFFTIRQWLYANPKQARAVMEKNPSYVFFRILDTKGPVGAAGAVLTKERSLAVDNRYIPYGLPLFLETQLPTRHGSWPYRRLMIAQDTGTAIKGPVRGDIFFGPGKDAEFYAGAMKGRGVYSLLVPREILSQMP